MHTLSPAVLLGCWYHLWGWREWESVCWGGMKGPQASSPPLGFTLGQSYSNAPEQPGEGGELGMPTPGSLPCSPLPPTAFLYNAAIEWSRSIRMREERSATGLDPSMVTQEGAGWDPFIPSFVHPQVEKLHVLQLLTWCWGPKVSSPSGFPKS